MHRFYRFVALILLMSVLVPGNVVAQITSFRGDMNPDQNSIGDLKWFEVFKDPELQKLIRTAMVQNYDLRTAGARINAARANLGLARSDQFPQFEASADLTPRELRETANLRKPGRVVRDEASEVCC